VPDLRSTPPTQTHPAPGREVLEPSGHGVPCVVHPEWQERFPWLVQGTTCRGGEGDPFDLRLFGPAPADTVLRRWEGLREAVGAGGVVVARQVHGSRVALHDAPSPGLRLAAPAADGHVTRAPGLLLAVSVADCVPVFLVDGDARGVALLHAGWRGVAAGILEEGVAALSGRLGVAVRDLHLHLGPSICGECYEVGPEVHGALGLPVPPGPTPLDLRHILARRALALGVPEGQITRSAHCTRRGPGSFFSHRAGSVGRQVAFLGIGARGGPNP
jgi:polyphenol oxidase